MFKMTVLKDGGQPTLMRLGEQETDLLISLGLKLFTFLCYCSTGSPILVDISIGFLESRTSKGSHFQRPSVLSVIDLLVCLSVCLYWPLVQLLTYLPAD